MDESSNYEIFKSLIRRTSKVLFAYDVDSESFTFLNNAFSQIWRRTRESVTANPAILLDTVHPEDRDYVEKEYGELMEGIIKYEIEFRIVLPDKSVSWLLVTPQLVTDAQGKRFVAGLVDDVTVEREHVRNTEKFAAKKDSILEILSHDLAGPLANIQGLADVLSEHTGKYGNSEVDNVIRIIRESSERSIRLIRDFVHHEFLESSHAGMVKRRINMVEKVGQIIDQYKEGESHIKKEIRFTHTSDKFYAYVDENKFMQVINNLFSNAIKFTHDNGVISIDLSEQEASALITVKDNGIGIPKRYHGELFDRFTPARREGLRGEPSTGLGMSIIKTIVEWHGGTIRFESEEGEGTAFYIEIPKK